ncbi:MAG: hypothetical protein FWH48_06610 [Oscillospiraceae bacterium]|nr:hypothetical protein [Oscillospiraceae bacterium]
MKKLSLILLALVLACAALALYACGDGADKAESTTDEAIEETTPEPATPAPTPEPPPTEPPTEKPPIITEIVDKWTFSEDNLVFRSGNQIEDLRVEGNILKLTSIGGDPFMYSINNNLGMNAEDVDYIKVMVKNGSAAYGCQIFFITTDNGGYSEDMSLRGDYWYADGEEWEEYIFETEDCDLWEGTIKEIRFDPMVAEGDFEMEYMSFEKIVK